jgi:hypothetical protein
MTAAVTAVLLACAPVSSSSPPPDPSVTVIGDSLTSLAKTEFDSIGASLGFSMTTDGVAGLTFEDRIAQITRVADDPPDALVIELGTNDVNRVPIARTSATIAAAVTALDAAPCVVFVNVGILVGGPGGDAAIVAINDALEAAVVGHPNMSVYDWSSEFHQHPNWSLDTIHLKPEFHGEYASHILDAAKSDCAATLAT